MILRRHLNFWGLCLERILAFTYKQFLSQTSNVWYLHLILINCPELLVYVIYFIFCMSFGRLEKTWQAMHRFAFTCLFSRLRVHTSLILLGWTSQLVFYFRYRQSYSSLALICVILFPADSGHHFIYWFNRCKLFMLFFTL